MARYDRRYDYGLRGARDTTGPYSLARQARAFARARSRALDYAEEYAAQRYAGYTRTPRVTAPYNLDYVFTRHDERFPRRYEYGAPEEPVGDLISYRLPYTTVGGTRTWRGQLPLPPAGAHSGSVGYGEYDLDFYPERPPRRRR